MTTITSKLTDAELKVFCSQSERVLVTGNQLMEDYDKSETIEKLDKGWSKCTVAATPSLIALQGSAQTQRPPEFALKDFLNPLYRKDSFDRLFARIEQIKNRSETARSCYRKANEYFDRIRFNGLTRRQANCLDDYTELMQLIKECIEIIKYLLYLIISD